MGGALFHVLLNATGCLPHSDKTYIHPWFHGGYHMPARGYNRESNEGYYEDLNITLSFVSLFFTITSVLIKEVKSQLHED